MENVTIEVAGCNKCPFLITLFEVARCVLNDKLVFDRTPDWCPLETQVITVRKPVPDQQFEERVMTKEV